MENMELKMGNILKQQFWRDKKVFLTGHTGFKGSWMTFWLNSLGAKVCGYSLQPNTFPSNFELLGLAKQMQKSNYGDIRDYQSLENLLKSYSPDIVIHMAAQPLVQESYANPRDTYEVNVMGTVNVLEAIKNISTVKATIIVTTDKCYENNEWLWSYRENDQLGGTDPYSSSKTCAEIITRAYQKSFFTNTSGNKIATVRAGNVIGGGDWATNRLVPDLIRAIAKGSPLIIRNPQSVRPWQHVLEPLSGYLLLTEYLYENCSPEFSTWNFGPHDYDAKSVKELVNLLICSWGENIIWTESNSMFNPESKLLKLDSTKAQKILSWSPQWSLEKTIEKTVDWYKCYYLKNNLIELSKQQIAEYQYG